MTTAPPANWSSQQLIEFLAALYGADEDAASRIAIERVAEGLDAEVAALVRDGRLVCSIGFPPGLAPEADLRALARGAVETLDVDGLGACLGLAAPVSDGSDTTIVVARYGALPFLPEEVGLAQGIGRILGLTLRVFRIAEAERRQRGLLERLARVQRSVTSGVGRERLFESIVRGATELLDDDVAALMLRDPDDPLLFQVVASVGQHDLPVGSRVPAGETLPADPSQQIAVPVHERGEPVGTLIVASRREGRRYEAEEREVLLAFGEHASLALTDAMRIEARRARDAQRVEERYEARLRQAQRLESVGQLAGGIAHDFNNLLVVILNYARFVMDELDEESRAWADTRQIAKAAERASDLTKQLLLFSRRGVFHPTVVDPAEVVADVERLLQRTLTESITVSTNIPDELPRIEADPTQLEQVILNLAVNARDAMPDGGLLEIALAAPDLDPEAARALGLEAGPYVRLVVSDTGRGMSQHEVDHAFEPFFTTKPKGQGTGLGLATVFGIVTQAKGAVAIDSEPGEGTRVSVHIPATDKSIVECDSAIPTHSNGQPATVLVVEDEEAVRDLACRILSQNGYRVISADGPDEALAEWERHDGGIDLLLTDVVMPAMSGTELASRLASRDPDLAHVFMSGYADKVVHGLGSEGAQLLEKPFTADELLAIVRGSLEDRVSV